MDPTLLTVTEAARRLALGRATTYQLVRRGEIPSIRVGRAVRVPVHALDAWIAARTTGGEMPEPDRLGRWSRSTVHIPP